MLWIGEKMNNTLTLYLCDQKKKCKTSVSCQAMCRHTADINHARLKAARTFAVLENVLMEVDDEPGKDME